MIPYVGLIVVLLTFVPFLAVGSQESTLGFSVWILNTSPDDIDTDTAVQTLRHETAQVGLRVSDASLNRFGLVPACVDLLVLVGHGQPEGLLVSDEVVPWPELYGLIVEHRPQRTIILACYSPSDPSLGVFGFNGRVDAEAGALVVSWFISQTLNPKADSFFPLDRVASAQANMLHPLGRYLYFVHGYWGTDADFELLYDYFRFEQNLFETDYDVDNVRYFDYFEYYSADSLLEMDAVHWAHSTSEFADNLFNELLGLPSDSQVTIIAHSMGGLITREMLRLHRDNLDSAGISLGKVITLGTPQTGTWLANPANNWAFILSTIGGLIINGELWP
jgi:pimeloyl-ACP methyl ester carboxylesterase